MNFMTADVEIKVDDSRLSTQLAKARSAVTRTVDRIKSSFRKMGASFKAVFSKMVKYAKYGALAIAGAFALVTRNAMKQEDVINRLNITLKATGHAAGFSAKELLEQAAALQKVTRFGDETTTAMMTMLLTFKNIKGDEFKRATEAALDMATAEAAVSGRALDLTATSIRLGKALNDPIQGITALSRVGVQFTEDQKDMIKAMVEAGDVAGAQAVILKELEGEFGGMARDVDTASGALKQMWNALGDVTEKIGAAFIPGIKDSARAVKEWAERNEEKIGRWAEAFVEHLTYAKDVLWGFIQFLQSDWKAGIEYALAVSKELFIGFANAIYAILQRTFFRLAKDVGSWTIQIFEEMLVQEAAYRKKFREGVPWWSFGDRDEAKKLATEAGNAAVEAYRKVKDMQRRQEFEAEKSLADALVELAKETAERIAAIGRSSGIIAPAVSIPVGEGPGIFGGGGVEQVLSQTTDAIEETTEAVGELTEAQENAIEKMRQWADEASDIWGGLADVAISALEGTADALTDLVLKGKADFNALAESILRDLTRMIIKAQMARIVGAVMGGADGGGGGAGLFGGLLGGLLGGGGAPGLQHGGEVAKTGLAVVHKGERFSGTEGGNNREAITLNMNVNAIDAAGTYQFLNKNKRSIATMLQGTLTSNHPLRKAKGWK